MAATTERIRTFEFNQIIDMGEEQDLTKPILDPILLLVEGTGRLPANVADVAPVDSLEEFDRVCTINVRDLLSQKDRDKIDNDRRVKSVEDKQEEKVEVIRKQKQNILSRINDQWSSGPISILHRALTKRLRVKVWIRNHSTIRSILVGFVAAFDKHLNMALVDVDEVTLLRSATIKSMSLALTEDLEKLEISHNEQEFLSQANSKKDKASQSDYAETSQLTKAKTHNIAEDSRTEMIIGIDQILDVNATPDNDDQISVNMEQVSTEIGSDSTRTKRTKASQKKRRLYHERMKTVSSQRFLPQLFIRGENVVLVTFADTNTKKGEPQQQCEYR